MASLNPTTTVDLAIWTKMEGHGQAFPLDVPSFDLRNFSGNVELGNMFNPGNAVGGDQQGSQQQLSSGGQQSQPHDSRNAPFFGQFGAPIPGGIGLDDFQLLLNMGPNTQNTHSSLSITAEQLKEQLAQQLKLQQLQQLQNRILQEQVRYTVAGSISELLMNEFCSIQIQLLTGSTLGNRTDIQQLLTPGTYTPPPETSFVTLCCSLSLFGFVWSCPETSDRRQWCLIFPWCPARMAIGRTILLR